MARLRVAPIALAALLLAGCTSLVSNEADQLRYSEANSATRILVTIPQPTSSQALGLVGAPGQSYQRRRGYGPTPSVDRGLDRIARDYGLKRVRGWPIRSLGVYCEVLEVAAGSDADRIIERLLDDPRIDVAQRMNVFETLGTSYNDPYADLQTSVTALAVENAHRLATGRGVSIAIIDSQVDVRHPELKGSVRHIRDLVTTGLLSDPELHGTAVAGIIASAANNTEGIVGIAPDASIAALRACWTANARSSAARCTSFSLAQALEAALDLEVGIINMSLAGPEDPLLTQLLDEAARRSIIVVAARGAGTDAAGFPASHPAVIAAAEAGGLSEHREMVLAAPGTEILTTTPDAGYAFFSGDSLAAAHVTGVAALLLEKNPGIDTQTLAALLSDTAGTVDSPRSINACRALSRLLSAGDCGAAADSVATLAEPVSQLPGRSQPERVAGEERGDMASAAEPPYAAPPHAQPLRAQPPTQRTTVASRRF